MINIGEALRKLIEGGGPASVDEAMTASLPVPLPQPDVGTVPVPPPVGAPVAGAPVGPVATGPTLPPPPPPSTPSTSPPITPVQASPMVAPATGPQPTSLQSPPDLANMYMKIMESDQRAAMRDEGMTMLAAGLTPRDEVRGALLNTIGRGARAGGRISMNDIIEMQKMQQGQADAARQRAQLPGIMKQYGLDEATVQYLDATGQLDEVVGKLANPDTEVVEKADGSKILIDKRTGNTVHDLSPAKPRDTEFIDAPSGKGGKVLVYKDDKTPVSKDSGAVTEIAAPPRKIIQIDDPSGKGGKVSVYEDDMTRVDTGEKVTKVEAPPRKIIQIDDPEGKGGKVSVYEDDMTRVDTGEQVTKTAKPAGAVTVETLANGKKQAFQDGKPVGDPVGPENEAKLTDDIKEHAAYAAAEVAAGKSPTPFDVWFNKFKKLAAPAGTKNYDPGKGEFLPDPPTDMVWDFSGPDGAVKRDENGAPVALPVKGSKTQVEQAAAKEKEAAAAASRKGAAAEQIGDVDAALKMMTDEGDYVVAGPGPNVVSGIPILGGYTPQGRFSTKLGDITSRISLQELQRMISESPRGASGLGNVTEFEQKLLSRIHGSIRQGMDPRDLRHNLERYKKFLNKIVTGEIKEDDPIAKEILESTTEEAPTKSPRNIDAEYGTED